VARTMQASFASGELTPALHARVDLSRYLAGLKTCRNMLIRPEGGAANRAGTRHVAGTKGIGRVRLLPFSFNAEQTYVLEFGERYVRFFTGGFRLRVNGTDAAIINGMFINGLTPWEDASEDGGAAGTIGGIEPVPLGEGVPIGNMTAGAGLAAAFDGLEEQDSPDCARVDGPADGRIGKDWGLGHRKRIRRFRLVGSRDRGFKSGGGNPPISVEFQGSDDDFVDSAVTLGEWFMDDHRPGVLDVTDDFERSTLFRSHRVRIRGGGEEAETYVAELEFFEEQDDDDDVGTVVGRLNLVGAAGGVAAARQRVDLSTRLQTHVLIYRVIGGATTRVKVRIGSSAGGSQLVDDEERGPGIHSLEFIPGSNVFWVEFRNEQDDTAGIDSVSILGQGRPATENVTFELPTPYQVQDLRKITHTQSADVMTLAHTRHEVRELRRLGALSWSIAAKSFQPSLAKPAQADFALALSRPLPVAPETLEDTVNYAYRITYVDEGGLESEASGLQTISNSVNLGRKYANEITIDFPYPAGVVRASVYKLRGGEYGYIGSTKDGTFVDDGILPALDDQPPEPRLPFDRAGDYPGAVAYFEQRLVLAGSRRKPDTFEMSQPGAYSDFARSESTKDSDSITGVLASREVNRILHLADLGSLLMFTTGAVWRLGRGERGLTPALEGGIRKEFAFGCDPPPPLEIGSSVLFVQAGGRTVRDLSYDDSIQAVGGAELSLLSSHLLENNSIVEWAWAADPDQTAWMVRDDGTLLTLAYLRDQEVVGWARQETRGAVESVCTVREEGRDAVYIAVERIVNGFPRRNVERFTDRDAADRRDLVFLDDSRSVDRPLELLEVRLQDPLIIKAADHRCVVGDLIDIDGGFEPAPPRDDGTTPDSLAARLNGERFTVLGVGGDTLTLGGRYAEPTEEDPATIDASDWPKWFGGGVMRKCVTEVTDLEFLRGETLSVVADGDVHPPKPVIDDTITLEYPASRVHVGIPYVSDLETLSLALEPELYGSRKAVKQAQLYLDRTRGLKVGPARQDGRLLELEEWKQRQHEDWNEAVRPRTGLAEVTVTSVWSDGGAIRVRQDEPLPVEILAILPVFERGS
jgi:hypothetical protein